VKSRNRRRSWKFYLCILFFGELS